MADMVNVRRPSGSMRYRGPEARFGRSQFDLTHSHKTTFDAGELIPYFVTEVVPGDTMTCKLTAFARVFSPLESPIMDDIEMDIHFFYVPNRLVWTNWKYFLGEHDAAGAQDTDFTVPIIGNGGTSSATTSASSRLRQYMGLPEGLSTTNEGINALPFRAYALIYNDWYRDQNLIDPETVNVGNGPDTYTDVGILRSAKKHDYFTTALPYLQKGTAQDIPFTGTAEIHTDRAAGTEIAVYSDNAGVLDYVALDSDAARVDVSATAGTAANVLYADLSTITGGATINALREAVAIQRLLERDARGGTRIPELIRAHFGVDVPDYRVQRPEYLGGGRGFINVSPVANTSATATEQQGYLTGTASGVLTGSFAKSFVEHGYVLGILRARGQVTYQQGTDRMWTRSTKYDFLWPELAQLGEQPIYNKELWYQGDATDDNVFGYQERYAEYRYKKSMVTGILHSDATGSIDYWHLAEDFAAQPTLNQTFIEDATPMARVTIDDSAPDFIIDGRFDLKVARVLPVRPTPTLGPARF